MGYKPQSVQVQGDDTSISINSPPQIISSRASNIPSNEYSQKGYRAEPDSVQKKTKLSSYKETAIQEALMLGAQLITNGILHKLGIRYGNVFVDESRLINEITSKPIQNMIISGILDPVLEEAIWRLFPSKIIAGKTRAQRWDIGIPTSALFALVHNFDKDDFGKLQFHESIPLSQFMAGMFFWKLMREKGFNHAVLAHSMNNAIPLSIATVFYKAFPPEQAKGDKGKV